jgi:hypothetical protein
MAFLIGQCCDDDLSGGDNGTPSVTAPINEIIDFSNVGTLTLAWNSTRKSKYGRHGNFTVWIQNEDGDYVIMSIQAIPNDPANPSQYDFDFGGLSTGYIVIT